MTQYYTLTNNRFDDSKFAYGERRKESFNTGEAKLCEGCKSFISMLEWLPPFEIKVSKKNLGDFIFGTHVGFIVSKKFKDKYVQNGNLKSLSSFKKVSLYYKGKLLDDSYYYPDIPLISAFIDLNFIEFSKKDLCDTCQKGRSVVRKINSITFMNPNQIEEDVFFTTAIGQGRIILSEKFKSFVEKESFTNLKIINGLKFEWDSLTPHGFK